MQKNISEFSGTQKPAGLPVPGRFKNIEQKASKIGCYN